MKSIEQNISSGKITIENTYKVITDSILTTKKADYKWEESKNNSSKSYTYQKGYGIDSVGDIVIKEKSSALERHYEAYLTTGKSSKFLGKAPDLESLKARAEQFNICAQIKVSIGNHLSTDINHNAKHDMKKIARPSFELSI